MLGNFIYANPTKLYFGDEAQKNLAEALSGFGKKVLLTYGGGSIKRNGVYDDIIAALKAADKEVVELPGVMPNPTVDKLNEGRKIAYTDATHGMTLSGISVAYYRYIMKYAVPRFARFARVVWEIPADGKSDELLAEEGINALAAWIKEIGAASEITSLGVTPEMLDGIADSTIILDGGYKKLGHDEIVKILQESM